MGRFAKNFLPILFNVYSQPEEDGGSSTQRRSVLDTVRAYLTITDPQVRGVWGRLCWLRPASPSQTQSDGAVVGA